MHYGYWLTVDLWLELGKPIMGFGWCIVEGKLFSCKSAVMKASCLAVSPPFEYFKYYMYIRVYRRIHLC